MQCSLCAAVALSRAGAHPDHIADLSESALLLFEHQGCPGWCVLVVRGHDEHLELLEPGRRARLLDDLARAGLALRLALDVPRLNYACLCNQVPHLHWHLIPRRPTDPPGPVWTWPEDRQRGRATDPERRQVIAAVRSALREPQRQVPGK
jgi:diadenosine tetraphosphate (Ap4A) HIT family hydrolase